MVQVLHNGLVLGRRRFLKVSSAAPLLLHGTVAGENAPSGLTLEYEITKPPPLPPGIRRDATERAIIEFWESGTAAQCSLGVRVRLEGAPYVLPLAVWTGDSQAYWHMREAARLPAFRGEVRSRGNQWSLSISGRQSFRARPGPAEGLGAQPEPTPPWLVYRYAMAADWRRGPLAEGPVQLWSIRSEPPANVCELSADAFETAGDMGGWLTRLGAQRLVAAKLGGPGAARQSRFERDVDRAEFEPYSFRTYRGGSFGVPPESGRATAESLAAYRRRREDRLSGLVIVSVDCYANRSVIEGLLPPPCHPAAEPALRVMALRGLDDPSLDEAWLLAECSLEGTRVWYAIAHVRGSLGGTAFGREILGYPTKGGSASAALGGNRFAATVERDGRLAYQAGGSYGGFSTGTTLSEMTVATLRLGAESGGGARAGEIVTQPWYYQGLRKPVHRASLHASFPAAGGGDVWNSMGPVHAYTAMVMDGATMQRLPGKPVAAIGDVAPYYRDRCDGRLPWEWHASDGRNAPSD